MIAILPIIGVIGLLFLCSGVAESYGHRRATRGYAERLEKEVTRVMEAAAREDRRITREKLRLQAQLEEALADYEAEKKKAIAEYNKRVEGELRSSTERQIELNKQIAISNEWERKYIQEHAKVAQLEQPPKMLHKKVNWRCKCGTLHMLRDDHCKKCNMRQPTIHEPATPTT